MALLFIQQRKRGKSLLTGYFQKYIENFFFSYIYFIF